jgi:hypothetical protein
MKSDEHLNRMRALLAEGEPMPTPFSEVVRFCRHGAKFLARSPRNQVFWWCGECQQKVTKYVTECREQHLPHGHSDLKGIPIHTLPIEGTSYYGRCEHCRAIAPCDVHHTAPQSLFPDADSWTVVHLCRKCHDLWHEVVTPYMPGYTEPTRLAEILVRWVPEDQLRKTVAKMREMLSQKAEA